MNMEHITRDKSCSESVIRRRSKYTPHVGQKQIRRTWMRFALACSRAAGASTEVHHVIAAAPESSAVVGECKSLSCKGGNTPQG